MTRVTNKSNKDARGSKEPRCKNEQKDARGSKEPRCKNEQKDARGSKEPRCRNELRDASGTRNTGEIVLSAIKKLMKNTGWTSRTIIKFIKMEYGVGDPKISRKVSRALRRGVKLGLLMMERGRYRLNDMSNLARPVSAQDIRKRQKPRRRASRPLRMRSPSNSSLSRK